MTDENTQKQPLSMTRRYRRGLILTGLLCVLAVLTAATLLFQRSYVERMDNYMCPDLRRIRRRLQGAGHPRCHVLCSHAAGEERPHPAHYADRRGRHRAF